jgi:hypothetical protein
MGQVRQGAKEIPKVIEAEKFVVKDSSGREKATLGMTDLGPSLELKETYGMNVQRVGGFATVGTTLGAGVYAYVR